LIEKLNSVTLAPDLEREVQKYKQVSKNYKEHFDKLKASYQKALVEI
jgi:hypothetical protein